MTERVCGQCEAFFSRCGPINTENPPDFCVTRRKGAIFRGKNPVTRGGILKGLGGKTKWIQSTNAHHATARFSLELKDVVLISPIVGGFRIGATVNTRGYATKCLHLFPNNQFRDPIGQGMSVFFPSFERALFLYFFCVFLQEEDFSAPSQSVRKNSPRRSRCDCTRMLCTKV